MQRRTFFTSIFKATCIQIFGGFSIVRAKQTSPLSFENESLTHLLSIFEESLVQEIGQSYLNAHSDEQNPAILRQILSHNEQSSQIRLDFAEQSNEIFNIHGWMLSRTEARQCALYSLSVAEKRVG